MTPIIDAHCHAWHHWPYQPPVPDPLSRAHADRLLWEMDQCGVASAILISASIDHNPDNADDSASCARASGGRLLAFPDVDCRWHPAHHSAGAAQRLQAVVQRLNPIGFTHYLFEDRDPSWLLSDDGLAFFAAADALRLIVSLACGARQMPTVTRLADRFPDIPFLIHHLGRVKVEPLDGEGLRLLLAAAASPNIHIKLSGFGYAVEAGWDFPCADTQPLVRALYEHFGASRLLWGSDYPVSQRYMTYRQTLEIVRSHCAFIPHKEMQQVLGGNMQDLIASRQHHEGTLL
jgi:predicted TIM-barrel fold metal-dependent hydrolase